MDTGTDACEPEVPGKPALKKRPVALVLEPLPTAELAAKYLPQVQSVRKSEGRWSGYDTAKAEKILGFRAKLLLHN